MLEELHIENYQSWKDGDFTFTPGLNVFTGTSGSGKSAVIRALIWFLRNEPEGDEFKNWDNEKNKTLVAGKFDDLDDVIIKERDKRNVYILPNHDVPLEAIRTGIPNELLKLTRMGENNFKEQHDKYFLLSNSPGEVARKLNKLVKLDIIHKTSKKINEWVSATSTEISQIVKDKNDKINQLNELDYLDDFESQLSELEQQHNELNQVGFSIEEMRNSIKQFEKLDYQIKEAEKVINFEEPIKNLLSLINEYITTEKNLDEMAEVGQNIAKSTINIKGLERISSHFDKAVKELQELISVVKTNNEQIVKAKDLLSSRNKVVADIAILEGKLTKDTDKYIELIKQYPTCPICESAINAKCISKIKERLLQ